MAGPAVHTTGLREFIRASDRAGKETKTFVRDEFRPVGELVRAPVARDYLSLSEKTATGFRTIVRQRGVTVEQTRRKTTGKRRDWALRQTEDLRRVGEADHTQREIAERFGHAVDRVADHFERG